MRMEMRKRAWRWETEWEGTLMEGGGGMWVMGCGQKVRLSTEVILGSVIQLGAPSSAVTSQFLNPLILTCLSIHLSKPSPLPPRVRPRVPHGAARMASLPARALPLPELLAVLVWGVSLRVCMEGSPLCVSLPDLSRWVAT